MQVEGVRVTAGMSISVLTSVSKSKSIVWSSDGNTTVLMIGYVGQVISTSKLPLIGATSGAHYSFLTVYCTVCRRTIASVA